jgi:hypothetical protein
MMVKMKNGFIRQAIEVEDREAVGGRVATPREGGDLVDLTSRSRGQPIEGVQDGGWPHLGRGRATCDAMRGAC